MIANGATATIRASATALNPASGTHHGRLKGQEASASATISAIGANSGMG